MTVSETVTYVTCVRRIVRNAITGVTDRFVQAAAAVASSNYVLESKQVARDIQAIRTMFEDPSRMTSRMEFTFRSLMQPCQRV